MRQSKGRGPHSTEEEAQNRFWQQKMINHSCRVLFVCSCILERKREKVGNPEKIWHCNEWVVIFTWLAGGYSQAFLWGGTKIPKLKIQIFKTQDDIWYWLW